MTDTPEPQTEPTAEQPTTVLPTAPATESRVVEAEPPVERNHRLYTIAAWIAIVAGSVFIIAVIFLTGFFVGECSSGGHHGHHHHHHGGYSMFHGGGPMNPWQFPRGGGPGGPGGPGGFGGPGGGPGGPSGGPGGPGGGPGPQPQSSFPNQLPRTS